MIKAAQGSQGPHELADAERGVRGRRSTRFVERVADRRRRGAVPAARSCRSSAASPRSAWSTRWRRSTLKLGSPGVPDFYQGTELWDLSLVDPDNRRPVDFDAPRSDARRRRRLLALAAAERRAGARRAGSRGWTRRAHQAARHRRRACGCGASCRTCSSRATTCRSPRRSPCRPARSRSRGCHGGRRAVLFVGAAARAPAGRPRASAAARRRALEDVARCMLPRAGRPHVPPRDHRRGDPPDDRRHQAWLPRPDLRGAAGGDGAAGDVIPEPGSRRTGEPGSRGARGAGEPVNESIEPFIRRFPGSAVHRLFIRLSSPVRAAGWGGNAGRLGPRQAVDLTMSAVKSKRPWKSDEPTP